MGDVETDLLSAAVATVPAGAWAVGVSGGADSVALVRLLAARADLSLHLVHLNHQTRGEQSDADAEFVRLLAVQLNVPFTLARRDEIERAMQNLPANPSARYRAIRLELFRRVVETHLLQGVILAHHADDQAETILQRLIRGSGYLTLAGIQPESRIGGLRILRPMLGARRDELRRILSQLHQPWREDASNESDRYQRNRVRKVLAGRGELADSLLALADACRNLRDWATNAAPALDESFPVSHMQQLPAILSKAAARQWLAARGSPRNELSDAVVMRLVAMAADSATPAKQQFPGGITVRRKKGRIGVS